MCLFALIGNGIVLTVLIFGKSKLDVPRFLVCNLALADTFMGIYLIILATADALTFGKFKVYAIFWQSSFACQFAGFLGVFSNELSVYTLSVITLERYYAINHAMHLNKRLSLKKASYLMLTGWLFSFVLAFLPLFGISDYRKFAICLPFDVSDLLSFFYVLFLILINGIAFFILMSCYILMYCALKGSHVWNSNDTRIAKRMAILVFIDFFCCVPVAFFLLTAVLGYKLISLNWAKVFTIFILPLNSCANPFLYAILTRQFKKDFFELFRQSKMKKNELDTGPSNSIFKTNLITGKKCTFNSRICQCNPFLDQHCSRRLGLVISTLKTNLDSKGKHNQPQFKIKSNSLFNLVEKNDTRLLEKLSHQKTLSFDSSLTKKCLSHDKTTTNRFKLRKLYRESKFQTYRTTCLICSECNKPSENILDFSEVKKNQVNLNFFDSYFISSSKKNCHHNELKQKNNFMFSSGKLFLTPLHI